MLKTKDTRIKSFIKKKVQKHFNKYILIFLLNAIIFSPFFFDYIQSDIVSGWDGMNHFAIAEIYTKEIFPDIYGWTDKWHNGMVWPLGYPPFFYYFFAIASKLIQINTLLLFKLIFVTLMSTFPVLIMKIGKRLNYDSKEIFVIGLLVIFFIASPHELFRDLGVTATATFKSGLYTQFFATYLFFVWLYFAFASNTKRNFLVMTLFLSLVFLSNIHVGQFALITIGTKSFIDIFVRKDIISFRRHTLSVLLAFFLISFWSFPLLENLDFFPSMTFTPLMYYEVIGNFGLILPSLLLGVFLLRNNAYQKYHFEFLLLVIITIILILSIVPLHKVLPNLPLQPGRLLVYASLLSIIIFPKSIVFILDRYSFSKNMSVLFVIIIAIPFIIFFRIPRFHEYDLMYSEEHKVMIADARSYTEGLSLYEVSRPGYPEHYNLVALAGINGQKSIWNVFRESSLNSTYTVPLRNNFSHQDESFGISCMLCEQDRQSFKYSTLEKRLARADQFNINYFYLNSTQSKQQFAFSNDVELIREYDDWQLFRKTNTSEPVVKLAKKPILLYTELESKSREYSGMNSYNWLRYNEEWLLRANFEHYFVWGANIDIDKRTDLEDFGLIIIETIHFKEYSNLVSTFDAYLKNNYIVILNSTKISQNLISDFQNHPHIFVLNKTGNFKDDYSQLDKIIDIYNASASDNYVIQNVDLNRKNQKITLKSDTSDKKFIYLKNSYFSYWRDKYEGNVYMVSPAMTLIITNNEEINLEFVPSNTAQIGKGISLIGISLIIIYSCLIYLNPKFKNFKKIFS